MALKPLKAPKAPMGPGALSASTPAAPVAPTVAAASPMPVKKAIRSRKPKTVKKMETQPQGVLGGAKKTAGTGGTAQPAISKKTPRSAPSKTNKLTKSPSPKNSNKLVDTGGTGQPGVGPATSTMY
jgi:hypothetical protein